MDFLDTHDENHKLSRVNCQRWQYVPIYTCKLHNFANEQNTSICYTWCESQGSQKFQTSLDYWFQLEVQVLIVS